MAETSLVLGLHPGAASACPRCDATPSPTIELSWSKDSGYRILRASKDPVPTILGRSKIDQTFPGRHLTSGEPEFLLLFYSLSLDETLAGVAELADALA
jgi:hypothetical protein